MKTVDFSETIAASDLKVGRCRQLIEIMKVPYVSIEGQGHFLTIYFPGFVYTMPRYQVSVYRTIGPLVLKLSDQGLHCLLLHLHFLMKFSKVWRLCLNFR